MARVWMGLGVAFFGTWLMAAFVQARAAHTVASSLALAGVAVVLAVVTAFQMGLIPSEATARSSFATARRLALSALWIVPTILLAREGSWMALGAGLFLFVSAARLVVADDEAVDEKFWRSLGVAVALQGVVVLHVTGMITLAVLLFGVGVATLVYMARSGPRVERRWRGVLSAALACLVTVLVMLPKFPPHGDGDQGVAAAKAGTVPNADGNVQPGEWHPGIIIWPKVRKKAVMMPPVALYPKAGLSDAVEAPLEIPFNGVYWLFQPPGKEPPRNSQLEQGTPLDFHFRSDDKRAIVVEARQSLTMSVPLRRLTGIRVALENGEPLPKTIWVELLLVSGQAGVAPVSLGRTMLATGKSTPEFRVPLSALIDSFDGLIVRLTRSWSQEHIASRVSIEKFVLIRR